MSHVHDQRPSYKWVLLQSVSHNALMIDSLMCRAIGCSYTISVHEGHVEAACVRCRKKMPVQMENVTNRTVQ